MPLLTADNDRFVVPKVYKVGATAVDVEGLKAYLADTGNEDFWYEIEAAWSEGISYAEILCVFFAKLCYKSLTPGKNANVTRTRAIAKNFKHTVDVGHGSVFEHVSFNFVVTDCSRVFTHEQVRHRTGVAYSQTSGRYCRIDRLQLVWDPILDGCQDIITRCLASIEDAVYLIECRKGLRKPNPVNPEAPADACLAGDFAGPEAAATLRWVPDDDLDFDYKKKVTSAARRIAPNGQPNEIGITTNLRNLRHTTMVRTAGGAEREIRNVYNQIFDIINAEYPLVFHGAKFREVDGLREIYGMVLQPYEVGYAKPDLSNVAVEDIVAELNRRAEVAEAARLAADAAAGPGKD